MISLSTTTNQTNGTVTFEELPSSVLRRATARASRVATLDGGCVVIHGGVADCDREFYVAARLTEAQATSVWAIYEAGTNIWLSCSEGAFLGYIAELALDNGNLSMSFRVKEKLSS